MRTDAAQWSDRRLVDAVLANGDEVAFRTLYRRHTPRLYQLVLRFLGGSEPDAEDVLQEAWLRVSEHLERFRRDSEFSTWLTAIGINLARDLLRRKKRNPADAVTDPPDPPTPPPKIAERIDLERAIAMLPDGYRLVVVLFCIEGMTHGEIAEHLGISEGASKSQLFAARQKLKAWLAPPEG
jgi:RNA polymerase sigma factor (sigma-70 family)